MAMGLRRPASVRQPISLVPMIDVMLILLVFFMVTSTYLNLDMIPVVDQVDDTPAGGGSGTSATVLVRIGSDGQTYLRGQALSSAGLSTVMAGRLADDPLLSVILLPSSRATTQALVSTMDTITSSGVTRLRLMQLEASQ